MIMSKSIKLIQKLCLILVNADCFILTPCKTFIFQICNKKFHMLKIVLFANDERLTFCKST